jgi:hypothetical protein
MMLRAALIALALTSLSLCIHPAGAQPAGQAQGQAPQQSSSDAFVAQLSGLLNAKLREYDACREQLTAAQSAAAKPPATPPAAGEGAKP